jgi:Xaa-Pro aminopeptidase
LRLTTLARDEQRRSRLQSGIKQAGWDAVVASLPENVLLLSGYFPVVGTSLGIITREGEVILLVPHDERDLAEGGGADRIVEFEPGSLDRLTTAAEAVRAPLRKILRDTGMERAQIGYESEESHDPASYAAMHLYGPALTEMFEGACMLPAAEFFSRMKAALTDIELERVRRSCRIAELGFTGGRTQLKPGMKESEAAAPFRRPLFTDGVGFEGARRADGYVACMAGANSSEAFGAYARSRDVKIAAGNLVLTHCNSYSDGYWTDITRTYCMGPPDERQRGMYQAVFAARQAALEAIRPGVKAKEVDRAAREVMRAHGLGREFKHATGHGVGFAAIYHNALPRLHPASPDVLETGMAFNIEPAAYISGFGGLRQCDMVAVTANGVELLTPFQCAPEELIA